MLLVVFHCLMAIFEYSAEERADVDGLFTHIRIHAHTYTHMHSSLLFSRSK